MALTSIDKVCDTILSFIKDQEPVYNTMIDRFYSGRKLNLFLGRRATFPASSLPAIEVDPISDTIGWFGCRTQQEEPEIEIDITTDNSDPESAVRLQAIMVNLTVRILSIPPHLRTQIKGTRVHLYDSLPSSVRYGKVREGRMRIATISWKGKSLEYLANRLFEPIDIPGPLAFPLV